MLEYVKSIFSAENVASYGRWSSFLALVVTLNWGSCYFFIHHAMPVVDNGWLSIILAPYGITTVVDVVRSLKGVSGGNSN